MATSTAPRTDTAAREPRPPEAPELRAELLGSALLLLALVLVAAVVLGVTMGAVWLLG